MRATASLLRTLESFRTLSDAALDTLELGAVRKSYGGSATLFREGDAAHGVFVVLSGEVRVVRSSRGRRYVLHVESAGGTLGEAPLFDHGPYPVTAVAHGAVDALYIARDALERAIRGSPELGLFFLARLGGRVRVLLERVDGLATARVATRLAAFLLENAVRTGSPLIAMTQESLAEELGTVREVVVRSMRALRDDGCIRTVARGHIEILDLDALRLAATRAEAR
ncbi:MAG TPA: Crp/Fnr family transcriptional regulator [Gemmatimonadaceae bacterium]